MMMLLQDVQVIQVCWLTIVTLLLVVVIYNLSVIRAHFTDREGDRQFINDLVALNHRLRDENITLRAQVNNWERTALMMKKAAPGERAAFVSNQNEGA